MAGQRWGDNLLRHLKYDDKQRVYFVPELGSGYHATTDGESWGIQPALGSSQRDAYIGVVGSRFALDGFLDIVLREPVPHTRLARRGYQTGHDYEYRYEPWQMNIWIDERNPRWGNTFKATFHSHELKLRRLKNFRAFLKLLQEAKCES